MPRELSCLALRGSLVTPSGLRTRCFEFVQRLSFVPAVSALAGERPRQAATAREVKSGEKRTPQFTNVPWVRSGVGLLSRSVRFHFDQAAASTIWHHAEYGSFGRPPRMRLLGGVKSMSAPHGVT